MVALFQSDSVAASARATAVQFAGPDQVTVLYRDTAVKSLSLTPPFTDVSGMSAVYDGLAATIEAIDTPDVTSKRIAAETKPSALRATLVAYYTVHSPESLAKVDAIVRKYLYNQGRLFTLLEEKYGVKVVPVAADGGLDEKVAEKPADQGQCNIVWLMSDGGENNSKKTSQKDIQKLVAAKRLAGWKFVYAWEATGGGASGADEAAAHLGFDGGLTINFASGAAVARTAVMEVVGDKVKEWWSAGCPNEIAFTVKERMMVAMGLAPSVSTDAIFESTVYV